MIVVQRQLRNVSAISWWEQVNFQWDDDDIRFALDQHAELHFYGASSLKQQSADRHVAPLGHIILIPSQPVFALSICIKIKKSKNVKDIFFVNVWRKNIFDIYVTEYGTALTTIWPILFLYLNTVIVTAGTFEP